MIRLQGETVPGPSVFPSGEPGVSGDFWGSQEGCQGPSRPSGRNRGLPPPAACSFPGENARSWAALGEARPGQSSLSAGALR